MNDPTDMLHVRISGHGPPVLWIHAFPLNGEMWEDQLRGIGGFRHVAPDLPGFGGSPPGPDPLTMEAAASLLVRLLDREGIIQAAVVGLSMGGYIALAFARLFPGRLGPLVLADTRATADSESTRAGRHETARTVMAEGVHSLIPGLLPKLVCEPESPVGERVAGLMRESSPKGVAAALKGMAQRPDSSQLVASLPVPCLFLCGEHDQLTPPAMMRELAAPVAGASFVEVPGAAHLPNLERPIVTNQVVEEFLRAHWT